MEAKQPEPFFSLYKLFWWAIYSLLLIGVLAVWIFFQVQVLGNTLAIG